MKERESALKKQHISQIGYAVRKRMEITAARRKIRDPFSKSADRGSRKVRIYLL